MAGQAQADAILAQGNAEAQAKEKIAEAFKQYGEAAVLSMVLEMMPDLVKEASQPLGNIEKISVVDTGQGGKASGANRITNYATNLLASSQETLKETTGLDIKELLENITTKGSKNIVNLSDDSKNE